MQKMNSLAEHLRRYRWDLALAPLQGHTTWESLAQTFRIVRPPRGVWYADPFILSVRGDEIQLLVEEFTYSIGRGRIARLRIDPHTMRIVESKILLDLPTHLSFPAIVRQGPDVYVMPENSEASRLCLYRLLDDELVPHRTLCSLPLTDAVPLSEGGRRLLLATRLPRQNGREMTVLKETAGTWQVCQTLLLDDETARSAGHLFHYHGQLVRPAQDCVHGYGNALVFQRLTFTAEGELRVEEIMRAKPLKGYEGMHTFNTHEGWAVVDLHTRQYPRLHRTLQALKHRMK